MRLRALILACLVPAAAATNAVAQSAPPLGEIYAESEGRVVGVSYRLKQLETETGVEGPKAEGALCGVVADATGVVIIPADAFPEPGGDPRSTMAPSDFRIYVSRERSFGATAIGIDRAKNIAFLRAESAALPHLKPVRFREEPALEVGDPVLIVGVLGRKYGFTPAIYRATVNAAVPGPPKMLGVDTILQDLTVGGLVLRRDGTAAGIVAKDIIGDDLDQDRSPGNVLSILASLGQPQSRRPGYPMVLPFGAFASTLASPPPLDLVADLKRAWIGIVMQALSRDLRDYWKLPVQGGIIVGSVVDGSPAQAAGLKAGDILTSFDEEPLRINEDEQLSDFRRKVELLGVGHDTPLEVYRDGHPMALSLKLGQAPKTASRAEEYEDEEFGFTVREITIDVQQALTLDPSFQGVVVSETEDAGWADVAGLSADDVILSVNGVKVKDVAAMRDALQDIKIRKDPEAVLFVLRPPDTLFIRIKTDFQAHARDER